MTELIDLNESQEKVISMAVSIVEEEDTPASLDELEEPVSTAGVVAVARIIQNRERAYPGTYLEKSEIDEVRELLWDVQAIDAICGDKLSPAQLRNLRGAPDTEVTDRTMVILDVFTSQANAREGKIRAELTQLEYRAMCLVGICNSLPCLRGGVGTKGPGEEKLGIDRGLIHQRIGQLEEELADVEHHREVTRRQKERNFALSVVVVGYANAGKSILLNCLTGAGILAEDRFFATLDPTTRSYTLEDGQQILLTDAVGFIRKLPYHLIEAFKSALEETRHSDIILHVVDCSDPQVGVQMHAVKETLEEPGIVDKTIVTVFNRVGRFRELEAGGDNGAIQIPGDFSSDYQVGISARTREGLEELQKVLQAIIRNRRILLEKVSPHSQAGRIQAIRKYGQLLEKKYQEDKVVVKAYVPAELFGRLCSS